MKLTLTIIFFVTFISQSYCNTPFNVIDWSNGNWAMNCDLPGNDISNAPSKGEDCYEKCRATEGCTHFTWTSYNGGTCWMKTGRVCKPDAMYEKNAVCGIRSGTCKEGGDLGDGSTLVYGDLLWSDDFDYTGFPSEDIWDQQTNAGHGWDNDEHQYNTKDYNAKVDNGTLVIETRKEEYGRFRYTSARLLTRKSFRYGIFEIRAKLPKGRGIWSAFRMLSDKKPIDFPVNGEIDVMEHVGYDPQNIHATVHTSKYNQINENQVGRSYRVSDPYNEYHRYTLDWTPDYIKAYADGIHYYTYENRDISFSTWPFNGNFQLLLNAAVGGHWGGKQGIDSKIFPTEFIIDYVRQYQNGFVEI